MVKVKSKVPPSDKANLAEQSASSAGTAHKNVIAALEAAASLREANLLRSLAVSDLALKREREHRLEETTRRLTSEDIAKHELALLTRRLTETQTALDKVQQRYHAIHNSRTWLMVRRSRKFREYFSVPRMKQRARRIIRTLTRQRHPKTPLDVALVAPPSPPQKVSAGDISIIVVNTANKAPSEAARNQIHNWIEQGIAVLVCGHARNWSKTRVAIEPSAPSEIIHTLNRAIGGAKTPFVMVLRSPEQFVEGINTIAAAFNLHDQAAVLNMVETSKGHVHAAGAVFDEGVIRPCHQGARASSSSVSRVMPSAALWPSAVVFDQDSFTHLGQLPFADTVEEALVAYGAKVRSRGLTIITNGLLRVESEILCNSYAIPPELLDNQGLAPLALRPHVLFADATTPTPDRDSGSIDIYWFLRLFLEEGYDVTFLPVHQRAHAGRYTDDLRLLGIETVQDTDADEVWEHVRDYGARYEVALLYRVTVATHLMEPMREFSPSTKVIFDTVDLHFVREERAAQLSGDPADAAQARATRAEELRMMDKADATILLSTSEDALVKNLRPKVRRKLISLVRHIPGRSNGVEGRKDAMFVGGFKHLPNVEAALFLCRDIWPAVRQLDPSLTVHIIGNDAPPEILAFHNPDAGINMVGFVDSLTPYYETIRLNLAPLTFGAGVKGKVAASLSVGMPTIGTAIATEGMWLTHNEDVIVADTVEDFAKAVVTLSANDVLWEKLSLKGIQVARDQFSIAVARKRLGELLDELGVQRP